MRLSNTVMPLLAAGAVACAGPKYTADNSPFKQFGAEVLPAHQSAPVVVERGDLRDLVSDVADRCDAVFYEVILRCGGDCYLFNLVSGDVACVKDAVRDHSLKTADQPLEPDHLIVTFTDNPAFVGVPFLEAATPDFFFDDTVRDLPCGPNSLAYTSFFPDTEKTILDYLKEISDASKKCGEL